MLFEFDNNMYETKKSNVYEPEEGLLKGNMFADLYEPYKNYEVKNIKVSSDKEALLLSLMMLDFAINDLNLYLAINPEDTKHYELFKKYCILYKKCKDEYEKNYQVLELTDDIFGKYTFGSNPWPWEVNNV